MERVESKENKELWIHEYDGSSPISLPFRGEFVCMIWNESEALISKEIVQFLLENGCRFAVCGGDHCTEQEREIDEAHVLRVAENSSTADIITTAHEEESIEEVTDFAIHMTNFGENIFSRYLLLYV